MVLRIASHPYANAPEAVHNDGNQGQGASAGSHSWAGRARNPDTEVQRARVPAAEHVVRVGPLAVGERGHGERDREVDARPGQQPAPSLPVRHHRHPQRQHDQSDAAHLRAPRGA